MNGTPDESPIDEKRLALEEQRLRLEASFARKWFPTLATVVIGLSAAIFGYVQNNISVEETNRAQMQARIKDEREWGFKVVEMYFQRRELFDLARNPEQAAANLRVLAAVAPTAVRGLLNAEQARLPAPGGDDTQQAARLGGLAVVADIQTAIAERDDHAPAKRLARAPSSFMVYIQYAEGSRDSAVAAQSKLRELGYKVPGIERVRNVPSRLQVRYYRPDQKEFAAALAIAIGQALGLAASSDNAILVKSDKALPDGILELWLPQLAKS